MDSSTSVVQIRSRRWRIGIPIFLIALSGCSGASSDRRPEGERRLQTLAIMYNRYAAAHKGTPPGDEKSLKEFINSMPGAEKEAMKITSAEDLFVSPRDQKPFKVRYGLQTGGGVSGPPGGPGGRPGSNPNPGSSVVIAYEQSGQSGKRLVAYGTAEVRELNAEEAQKLKLD